jgi:hypothetical protein
MVCHQVLTPNHSKPARVILQRFLVAASLQLADIYPTSYKLAATTVALPGIACFVNRGA